MSKRPTHADRIRNWLNSGDEITPIDAIRHFGCFRLAARICELRAEGMPIVDRRIKTLDGRGQYKAYRLDAS